MKIITPDCLGLKERFDNVSTKINGHTQKINGRDCLMQ